MDNSSVLANFLRMSEERDPGILRAIAAAGSAKALADFLGLHKTNITLWRRVPAKHVPAIANKYRITRHDLRPDLYRRQGKRSSSTKIIIEEETNISSAKGGHEAR
jgi:DNA-binding transcriptional regulator YdaS (Cro superfamily)